MAIFDHFEGSQYGKSHTWLSELMFYLETIYACAFVQIRSSEYITNVGVNQALSFLSTFILYYCLLFYGKEMRPQAKNCDKASLFFSFKSLNLLRNIQ